MPRLVAPLASVLYLLPLAVLAQASEERVTFQSDGQEVVATLQRPDGDPAPVVLMLHGFTGSRDEMEIPSTGEGIFARVADELAAAGYASLRIDFRGSGESTADLGFADTTFEGQVTDALAAVDYLGTLDTIVPDDLYLIGWSQGGLVATATAGRSGAFDAVALWAAVADPEGTFEGLLGPDALAAVTAMADGEEETVTLPWGAEIGLKPGFFEGIVSFDPEAEIAAYSGPLFVAQGSLDTTVAPASADLLIAAHEGEEELWTAEMDHVFNVFGGVETLDAMTAATIAYFDDHKD